MPLENGNGEIAGYQVFIVDKYHIYFLVIFLNWLRLCSTKSSNLGLSMLRS